MSETKETNYLITNLGAVSRTLPFDIMNTFREMEIASVFESKGYTEDVVTIYFDFGVSGDVLKSRGGYCKFFTSKITVPEENEVRYFLDYKKDKYTETKRFKLECEPSVDEICAIIGESLRLKPVAKSRSDVWHFFMQKVDLEMMFTNRGAFVDMVLDATTIENGDTPLQVVFMSLRDRTRAKFGEQVALEHSEKIDECIRAFNEYMNELQPAKEVSSNRYAEVMALVSEFQDIQE